MGKVPCEFWSDQPGFSFSGGRAETRVLPALPFPGWCIIPFGTFTRTCTAPQEMVVETCHPQGRQSLLWGRSPMSFEQIGQPSFFSRQLQVWFGTFTRTCTAPQVIVVGTCHLQGRKPLPWGRSPVSFGQICLGSVFQGKSWDKGPSSLALPRMVHHQWLAAPDMIWHIYSHLYCSSRDGGRDLPSSGEAAPTMGQVPCEFWADRSTFIFQPVAPDMIWHIYSGQHCFKGVLGMDLLSSGDIAPNIGQVPCEFWADWPTFIFQPAAPDIIWHIYLYLYCSLRDGGKDLPSSGRQTLPWGRSPVSFGQIGQTSFFQPVAPDMIWHIYSGQHCFKGVLGMDLLSSGDVALTMG